MPVAEHIFTSIIFIETVGLPFNTSIISKLSACLLPQVVPLTFTTTPGSAKKSNKASATAAVMACLSDIRECAGSRIFPRAASGLRCPNIAVKCRRNRCCGRRYPGCRQVSKSPSALPMLSHRRTARI